MPSALQKIEADEDDVTDSGEDKAPTLCLIDGSGFIFRAYHSLPPLTNTEGTPVGAVYGFINMLVKLVEGHQADYIAVIFDAARKTFRNDIYADYKANRPPPPEDLIPQFPLVKEATKALNIPAIELEGFEADDLIASYTKAAVAQGMQVKIISSDKDLMQLVDDGQVVLFDAMKNRTIGGEQVLEKFGVPPEKVIEVQALIGDSVDNVPGVPGIGPKIAAELIQTYGTLEGVLEHASEIKQNKRRESLIEFADQARLSKQLVILDVDVPLPCPLDDFALKETDLKVLVPFLQKQGFKSMLAKLGVPVTSGVMSAAAKGAGAVATSPSPAEVETQYELVQDAEALKRWIEKAQRAGVIGFDTETDSLDATSAELVGLSLSTAAGEACYVPFCHTDGIEQGDLLGDAPEEKSSADLKQMDRDEALALLKPMLEDASVLKVGHHLKFDYDVVRQHGIQLRGVDDTMLLSYVLDSVSRRHKLDDLCEDYLGITPVAFKDVVNKENKRKSFAEVPLVEAVNYAAEDADLTLRLYHILRRRLFEEKLTAFYERVERPLITVLAEMETAGVRIDPQTLNAMSEDFAKRLKVLEGQIYALAGREFTIGSPKQLGEILFDELELPGGKKSGKSGAYATGADILEKLAAEGHELPQRVLDWRQLAKLKSTYTDALQKQVNARTGRVHTSYSMTTTSTGRLSSNDPNLQNIPIRTEEGRAIRKAFVAKPGHVLVSADYSQIELRILAHMVGIESLIAAFKEGRDIHTLTASQVFGVALDDVDGDLRRRAKTINFGIIYGMSAFGLANRLGIDRKEAADYIDAYFSQYPGIRKYMDRVKAFAKDHGYVPTLYGRKCHLRGINDKNGAVRTFAERAAINAPMQGTAADIIKMAMIAVARNLNETGLSGTMLLQVHDELVFELPEARAQNAASQIKRVMETVVSLDVPLTVEVGSGANWGESH